MPRLVKFLQLSRAEQVLFLQAWCLLGRYRLALQRRSFAELTAALQHAPVAAADAPLTPVQAQQARRIGYLVAAAASATPWRSRCLVQSLVAQRLLARRGIPGQILLGVGSDAPSGFGAHAWLRAGGEVVNGAAGHDQYTVISSYRWPAGPLAFAGDGA